MSLDHLSALGLEVEQVENAARFHSAYARTVLSRSDAGRLSLAGQPEAEQADEWNRTVEAASSFRDAAMWSFLLSPQTALGYLAEAGNLYMRAGCGFGFFLSSIARSSTAGSAPEPWMDMMLRLNQERPALSKNSVPEPMRHPQQQTYALLGLAGSVLVDREQRQMLDRMILNSAHRDGVVPVGALGMPIRHFWRLAAMLLEEDEGSAVIRGIIPFLNRYADSVASAQANQYLWQNASSPVDIVDFDVLGIAVFASRKFGSKTLLDSMREVRRRVPSEGAVLLSLAEEVATFDG